MTGRVVPRTILIVAFLNTLSGCANREPTIYPVQIQVNVNGNRVSGAEVCFHPRNPQQLRVPVGVSGPDGTLALTTIRAEDGAPAGVYDITLIWADYSIPRDECVDPIHDRLKLRYVERGKSGLTVEVRPGRNRITLEVEQDDQSWNDINLRHPPSTAP